MPFQGIRINQQAYRRTPLGSPARPPTTGSKSTTPPNPERPDWAAALGTATPRVGRQPAQNDRSFVVWLGDANHPVDKAAAQALAESIRPWTPATASRGAAT